MKSLRSLAVGSLLSSLQGMRDRDRSHADCLGAVSLFSAGLRKRLQRPWKKTHNVDFYLGNKVGIWFLFMPL